MAVVVKLLWVYILLYGLWNMFSGVGQILASGWQQVAVYTILLSIAIVIGALFKLIILPVVVLLFSILMVLHNGIGLGVWHVDWPSLVLIFACAWIIAVRFGRDTANE